VFQLRVHIHGEWLEPGSTRGKPVVPGCDLEEVGLVGSKKVERDCDKTLGGRGMASTRFYGRISRLR